MLCSLCDFEEVSWLIESNGLTTALKCRVFGCEENILCMCACVVLRTKVDTRPFEAVLSLLKFGTRYSMIKVSQDWLVLDEVDITGFCATIKFENAGRTDI